MVEKNDFSLKVTHTEVTSEHFFIWDIKDWDLDKDLEIIRLLYYDLKLQDVTRRGKKNWQWRTEAQNIRAPSKGSLFCGALTSVATMTIKPWI